MRYKRCFCFRLLKTFKVWDSFAETLGFLTKKSLLFLKKIAKFGYNLLQSVSNVGKAQQFSKRSKHYVFLGKRWALMEMSLIFSKTLNVADLIYKASQKLIILKKFQNVQNLGFSEKKWFFSKNSLKGLKSTKLANIFSR